MNTRETQICFNFTYPHEQLELELVDQPSTLTLNVANQPYAMLTVQPVRNVTFHGENGMTVGTLSWQRGPMEFSGDAEESAKLFFDLVIKQYSNWTGILP